MNTLAALDASRARHLESPGISAAFAVDIRRLSTPWLAAD